MPEVSLGTVILGTVLAIVAWNISGKFDLPRGARALISAGFGGVILLLGSPVINGVEQVARDIPVLSSITETGLFLGGWVALIALTVFERKGEPRRVPYWAGVGVGVLATVIIPPVLDMASGKYQEASLHANVNTCTSGMLGQVTPSSVTNTCDFPIVVGLCLSTEKNPAACSQTVPIAAGATASLDSTSETLSSLPSNLKGLTVVACRPPHRPSRELKVGGRGYRGVCLPGA